MRALGPASPSRVIGIDLGTTNCCLSAYYDGHISILEIDGFRAMPSFVAFTDESYLVGVEAKTQMHLNPSNTVFDAKRLIGREFAEKAVQDDIANMHWPFLVRRNEAGRPYFAVRCLGEEMKVMPEMVAQLLLTKMKDTAEKYLGGALDGAVITVPAYFSDAQRQATKIAALQANINVLSTGIINEPTAAAMAYSRQQSQEESQVLIFDLGGGTFDVSVVSVDGSLVEVKSSHGDNHLGGEDITNNLVRHFLVQIQQRFGVNLQDPNTFRSYGDETPQVLGASAQRALLRLKIACEDIKCALSDLEATVKKVDYLWPQMPQFQAILERAELERMNHSIFNLCMQCTEKALLTAGVEPAALDQIVLVGGSTRIPKVKKMLADKFGSEKICDSVNPDEVVAYGAGVQAAGISGLTQATLIDVASHSLGLKTLGDVMSVVFPVNHRVGTTKERSFTTTKDNQSLLTLEVYEGEDEIASANTVLDSFNLTGLPKLPCGEVDVLVKFRVEFDGTLTVTAQDRSQGGQGRKIRKALKVNRAKEEGATRDRAEMAEQANKFAAIKHRESSQFSSSTPLYPEARLTAY